MVPTATVVRQAQELFQEIEYPALFHCKSGADRAGLMSAFLLYLKEGKPLHEAVRQLSLKYGHFRKSETGVLDYFFERYMAENRAEPMTFFEWLETGRPLGNQARFQIERLGERDRQPRPSARIGDRCRCDGFSGCGLSKARILLWVESGNAHVKQMWAVEPPKPDVFSSVPMLKTRCARLIYWMRTAHCRAGYFMVTVPFCSLVLPVLNRLANFLWQFQGLVLFFFYIGCSRKRAYMR